MQPMYIMNGEYIVTKGDIGQEVGLLQDLCLQTIFKVCVIEKYSLKSGKNV